MRLCSSSAASYSWWIRASRDGEDRVSWGMADMVLGSLRRSSFRWNEHLRDRLELRPRFRTRAVPGKRGIVGQPQQCRIGLARMTRGAGYGDVVMARVGAIPPFRLALGAGPVERS